jgi:hypothetical protein
LKICTGSHILVLFNSINYFCFKSAIDVSFYRVQFKKNSTI